MFTENRECCRLTQILVRLERRNKQKNYHISDCFFYNSNNAHYTLMSLAMPLCVCVCVRVCVCVCVWCSCGESRVWKPWLWQGDRVTARGERGPLGRHVSPLDRQAQCITGHNSVLTGMGTSRANTHADAHTYTHTHTHTHTHTRASKHSI